jgi:hypothetical protein
MKVLDARLSMFLDKRGRRYANAPDLDLLVDRVPSTDDFRFNFAPPTNGDRGGLFWAENDGLYLTYFHDGTPRNHGGLGGSAINLTMVDGSHRVIAGPWCGNPRMATKDYDFPPVIDVTLYERSFHRCGIANFWLSRKKTIEALKLVRFPGNELLRAVLMVDNAGPGLQEYDFAIIKRPGGDGREAPRLVRAEW